MIVKTWVSCLGVSLLLVHQTLAQIPGNFTQNSNWADFECLNRSFGRIANTDRLWTSFR